MSNPKSLAASFTLAPAICRTEYPAGGGNHTLHVSVTEERASADGYIAISKSDERIGFYITRDDSRKWSAQKLKGGIADNWFCRFDFPSRASLLAALTTVR